MKQVRDKRTPDTPQEDFRKLDALVLAELEAFERVSPKRRTLSKPEPQDEVPAGDNVIFKGEWVAEQAPSDGLETGKGLDEETTTPESAADSDAEPVTDLSFGEMDEQAETDLFTLEEQRFIKRTTEWLSQRENKDMIMSRIWAEVTETEPSSFFTTEEDNIMPEKPEQAPDGLQTDAVSKGKDEPQR